MQVGVLSLLLCNLLGHLVEALADHFDGLMFYCGAGGDARNFGNSVGGRRRDDANEQTWPSAPS